MFDVNDDAKDGFRRVEVLTRPGRRRRWSAAEKARIVDEAAQPGLRVSDVARRWQVCSQQIFGWRREARVGLAGQSSTPAFVPIVSEAASPKKMQREAPATPFIEIALSDAVVRVASCADDGALLTAVLWAVRASVLSACGGCGAGRVLSLAQMAKDRRLATATLAHVALRVSCHGCHDGPTRVSLTATVSGTEPVPFGTGVVWAILLVERSEGGAFRRRDIQAAGKAS